MWPFKQGARIVRIKIYFSSLVLYHFAHFDQGAIVFLVKYFIELEMISMYLCIYVFLILWNSSYNFLISLFTIFVWLRKVTMFLRFVISLLTGLIGYGQWAPGDDQWSAPVYRLQLERCTDILKTCVVALYPKRSTLCHDIVKPTNCLWQLSWDSCRDTKRR